jgi:hypothetical protein
VSCTGASSSQNCLHEISADNLINTHIIIIIIIIIIITTTTTTTITTTTGKGV